VTRAISWGRCSLIGLLVVMSLVAVLVLLLFSFPMDVVGLGGGCLSTCSLWYVTAICFGSVASCLVSFSMRRLPASSCSSRRASVPV